ncbi:MAG: Ppx/GppA family phosphatase, partial [Sphingomonadales bacterium]
MADFSPPDKVRSAQARTSGKGGRSSGKVADFRYKRPSQSEPRSYAKPPAARGDTGRGVGNGERRQAYAALDLGTNNCRLLIARPEGENFTVIDAFSRVVRLGEGLAMSGRLSDAAMDRAMAALHVCADKLRRRNVSLARSVATEACRRATNG